MKRFIFKGSTEFFRASVTVRWSKARIIKRTVKDNDGKMRTIVEKVIVYWSEKFYKKQMAGSSYTQWSAI